MRNRLAWLICFLVLAVGGFATFSWTRGQVPPAPQTPTDTPVPGLPSLPSLPGVAVTTPAPVPPASAPLEVTAAPERPAEKTDGKPNSPLYQQVDASARRGAEWLFRMHDVKGRFHYGFVPALNVLADGDNYLRQIGAACALARAAHFTGDAGYEARATQAILALLDETVLDPSNPQLRHTPFPSGAVNRLAAAGLLVSAISELREPKDDLLEKSEQLCNFIRKQQRPDGSLNYTDGDDEKAGADPEGVNSYPGEALHGLMRSQGRRPAAWKTELARKALAHYAPWWRAHKNMAFVPEQTAAYVEAYLLTKDKAFADFVGEMNDWLCELQHERPDPRHPEWFGGFMGWADGKPVAAPPGVASASYAESLVEACRVARETADLPRFRRYGDALERCLPFLGGLQYTEANTKHFVEWYRLRILGGFHASHQDGDLRIDYTQHAVCAMVQYLTYVAR